MTYQGYSKHYNWRKLRNQKNVRIFGVQLLKQSEVNLSTSRQGIIGGEAPSPTTGTRVQKKVLAQETRLWRTNRTSSSPRTNFSSAISLCINPTTTTSPVLLILLLLHLASKLHTPSHHGRTKETQPSLLRHLNWQEARGSSYLWTLRRCGAQDSRKLPRPLHRWEGRGQIWKAALVQRLHLPPRNQAVHDPRRGLYRWQWHRRGIHLRHEVRGRELWVQALEALPAVHGQCRSRYVILSRCTHCSGVSG